MEKILKGMVFKYGDDVNTDVIFPGKYTYQQMDEEGMASHALEDLDPEFHKKVKKGDFIVAGKNFGMGSSREQAVKAVKYAGITAVIAKSFSRIYFRNCINNGLLPIESTEASENIEDGEEITIDLNRGKIITQKGEFELPHFPDKVMEILEAGGLVQYTRKRLCPEEK